MTDRRILHPSDLSRTSQAAFAHALRLAVCQPTTLIVLHADRERDPLTPLEDLPRVRQTLHRWGLLDGPEGDLGRLGLLVKKVLIRDESPLEAVVSEERHSRADLLVLATHPPRWFRRSQAEAMLRQTGQPCLIVPQDSPGFVSLDDGSVDLQRVLLPVAWDPHPRAALDAATQVLRELKAPKGTLRVSHVPQPERPDSPAFDAPQVEGWEVEEHAYEAGDVAERIIADARAWSADLIVMTTQGHDSLRDRLFGSTVERVLRESPCPVLAVPTS